MKSPSTTVKDIIDQCMDMNRNDIEVFFKKTKVIKDTIDNLSPEVLENLAEKLTCTDGSVKDWKALAGRYGYSANEIEQFGSRKGVYAHHSPTMALFGGITASKPNMTLGQLAKALSKIQRNDVIEELKCSPHLSLC